MMTLGDTIVFVYRNSAGEYRALYIEDARAMYGRDEWEHVATLEPRAWVERHYGSIDVLERERPT